LKELCCTAHEKAGYATDVHVDEVILNLRSLVFFNEDYRTRKVDVVTYRIEEGTSIHERRRYWYFTEGIRKDCVFYLDPLDSRGREFKLQRLVCGIKVF